MPSIAQSPSVALLSAQQNHVHLCKILGQPRRNARGALLRVHPLSSVVKVRWRHHAIRGVVLAGLTQLNGAAMRGIFRLVEDY